MSRKGTEMSINVLVGIILGIVMLSASILLFFNIREKTIDTECQLDKQTEEKIKIALDTGDPVYVPSSIVHKGEGCSSSKDSAGFGVGIRNLQSTEKKFKIQITGMDGNPEDFDMERVAYLGDDNIYYYDIPAKNNKFISVAVNMKGITEPVTLLVKVQYNKDDDELINDDYWKPKIVKIQP